MDWQDIQDSAGEIFDIEQAREDIAKEKRARMEEEEFLDICNDLLLEGLVDEDAIEAEAHRILDAQENN
jgi:hypothetical protein